MQKSFDEESSTKTMRLPSIRTFLFAACLCLLAASAHAQNFNCPAYPSHIKSTIGTGTPPAEPIVVQETTLARVGANAVLCEYTVRVTGNYPPTHPISSCTKYPLVLSLAAPDPAPATGFTSWKFGTPGTPMGSTATVSAPQSIAPIYSMTTGTPPTRNCQVPNEGVFQFQIYSNFPTGETCTASGSSFSCAVPLCQQSLKGSQLPSANWSASSTAPGYYATDSVIANHNNGAPITWQVSLSAVKSAMGGTAAFNAATFTLPPNGVGTGGTGGGLPAGVISCSYDSPEFTYQGQPAYAYVTIACTTSCGSL